MYLTFAHSERQFRQNVCKQEFGEAKSCCPSRVRHIGHLSDSPSELLDELSSSLSIIY